MSVHLILRIVQVWTRNISFSYALVQGASKLHVLSTASKTETFLGVRDKLTVQIVGFRRGPYFLEPDSNVLFTKAKGSRTVISSIGNIIEYILPKLS